MQTKLKLAVIALCCPMFVFAQTPDTEAQKAAQTTDESAFTFTESQLGEDDNVAQEVTILGSNNNAYASNVGYRWSPVRFKYRAFGSRYSEVYINGNPANDAERGEFRYSFIGGLNNQTRTMESALPFEDNSFGMSAMAGSNNYNFRPSSMAAGHRISLAGGNRNYTLRAMYGYNSGLNNKGWAWSVGLTYRWANTETAYVEGTFYNALSYFLGVEKVIGNHNLSFVTWGNPTERGGQAASTDEMYWIANNRYYNPSWGYQNGKKRNARIINDFEPTGLFTWDWKIDDKTQLTTSLLGKYTMYSSSRLSYNRGTNPSPDYYSMMPSYNFNVWDPTDAANRTQANLDAWQASYDYLNASKANRQINWDRLYFANQSASAQGAEAMYFQQAYHDDQLAFSLASTIKRQLTQNSKIVGGFVLSANKGMHYQTLEDMLGATYMTNTNTYLVGTVLETDPRAQYDLNTVDPITGKAKEVKVGDRFAYDYNVLVNKAQGWATYSENIGPLHYAFSGRLGYKSLQRDGKMRNGLDPENSYGKGRKAEFVDGGFKFGSSLNLGGGHTVSLGIGYEKKAPDARVAFASPQINNDFAHGLKSEDIFSTEFGYQLNTTWVHANINLFYSYMKNVTEYSMYYDDVENSFTYASITGINKRHYGAEAGVNVKVTDNFDVKMLGTISDAEYINDADIVYMRSQDGIYKQDVVLTEGIHEGCTPMTAASVDLSYHAKGWFIDLIGNYYDKIYLYYSPVTRYRSNNIMGQDENGNDILNRYKQAKGHGGFMVDASIGKSIYVGKGSLSINLMLTNILNNRNLVTGGMEQNRQDRKSATDEDMRAYKFRYNPKKFYANGINGMLNITYKF